MEVLLQYSAISIQRINEHTAVLVQNNMAFVLLQDRWHKN